MDNVTTPSLLHEFSLTNPPKEIPDLSNHKNYMAEVLWSNSDLYEKLRDKKTSLGVSFIQCIKTGIDHPSHPHIKTCGIVAGDEESYQMFADVFDPVINRRHDGYLPFAQHISNLDSAQVNDKNMDPSGKYVLTSRVRSGRSIRGYRLSPAIAFDERRLVEKTIVNSLSKLSGELEGDYFPLHGSCSYISKPNGMSVEMEADLRLRGMLFQDTNSSPLHMSSAVYCDWPDARGVFHNKNKNAFVWVNEEDHVRVVSMEGGADMQGVFKRFVDLLKALETELSSEGKEFMYNDHLGYIAACPSNLGTSLRAGCLVKIPLLSSRHDFKERVSQMGLQARGHRGVDTESRSGIVDISNANRLGHTEVELVNIVINGVSQIIKWEKMLENGENIK
ncbi:creatine kinase B-type-like [Mytilus californianus]|uniref:creatine kinase B-type-like n=1 Tax=Mytilus californianus TaxID=6549 RepID=UPI0022456977|nr:creatine kinase B-type-like [Mytilus californianus]XP_052100443.1 creatine kinase B-type-like [Mytilus californianus]